VTPAEHAAKAEQLLAVAEAADNTNSGAWVPVNLQAAIAHGLLAVAYELGVPVQTAPAGGGAGG
jgi:hypothetical protein